MPGTPPGRGFWSVTKWADVRAVNRNPRVFSPVDGIRMDDSLNPETNEFFSSIIVMEDPRHAKLRMLVQKGFTPSTIAALEESVRTRARTLVEAARERGGELDFVEHLAAPFPLQVICDMLGVPPSDEAQIFEWTNLINGIGDPEFGYSVEWLTRLRDSGALTQAEFDAEMRRLGRS